MSENSGASFHLETSHIELPPPNKSEVGLLEAPQDLYAPTPRLGEEMKERGDTTTPSIMDGLDFDGPRTNPGVERTEIVMDIQDEWVGEVPFITEREEMVRPKGEKCKRKEDQNFNEGRKPEINETRNSDEDVRRRIQRIRAKEELLKQTEKLLATRSAELSGVHAFLSATDRLSEVEVLGIVHDLNENIYQVAVNLTDEWEKFESSQATDRMGIDTVSRPRKPAIVQRALSRNPVDLTFLLQSCLCSQVAKMTSSWGHHKELAILESIYQRLSVSGEHNILNLRQYVTYISQRDKRSQPDGGR